MYRIRKENRLHQKHTESFCRGAARSVSGDTSPQIQTGQEVVVVAIIYGQHSVSLSTSDRDVEIAQGRWGGIGHF